MASDYPTILQIAPIPTSSTKIRHARVQGIVTSLLELGYDSIVCTYPQSKEIQDAECFYTESNKKNIETHQELEKTASSTHFKLFLLSLKTYRNTSPMAVHTYGVRGLKIAVAIKLLHFWKRTRLICDLSDYETNKLGAVSRFSLTNFLIRFTNVVTCSSQDALETAQQSLGLNTTDISLIVSGIDPAQEFSAERQSSIREKLKIDSSKSVIVINANLDKSDKILKELQKLILNFKDKKDDIHFLVIGEPKKYLYAFLKKYDFREICSLVGDVDSKLLPQYYSVADIALSLDESDSNDNRVQTINFMANKLPVIGYNTRTHRDYLPKGTPLANSISSINKNLNMLLDDQPTRQKLLRLNIKRFNEFYSWEISKEQLYATYMQALDAY